MKNVITQDNIQPFKQRLEEHPIYKAIETPKELQCFMEHHIYSVWDFMSLIKYLQSVIAPTTTPWLPQGQGDIRRFINELVLEEESDETNLSGQYSSHVELYLSAMQEVGANTQPITQFFTEVAANGIQQALNHSLVPTPSREFTSTTFEFINNNKPHEIAAALALGREHIIPGMFRSILATLGVSEKEAPIFHYYLNRHVGLDEDFHAPLSLKLLNSLCDGDETKIQEALDAADAAINARLKFWDGVLVAIQE